MKVKLFLFFICFILLLIWGAFWYIRPYDLFTRQIAGISLWRLFLDKSFYRQHTDQPINFLFLGRAGGDFDSPDLTDSIIFVSLDLTRGKVYTIAIPRDIWSHSLNDKINTAYFYGKAKEQPLSLAKSEIAKIVGAPIQYAVLINFDRFQNLIDNLNGIDIYVERSFEDFRYPIAGRAKDTCNGDLEFKCRYEHVIFKKGLVHMNGITALKFARSRHSLNLDEGTDFARGQRQQKVMTAIYQKIFARIKKFDLTNIETMYFLINSLVERDIQNSEALYLAKELIWRKKMTVSEINIPKHYFTTPPYGNYGGKYVLLPSDGNFDAIHKYLQCAQKGQNLCEEID